MEFVEYFLTKRPEEVWADDTYISDGNIVVVKERLNNHYINCFKNKDFNLMKGIPYEKGEYWELPNTVTLSRNHRVKFVYNDKYCYDCKYIKLFQEWFTCLNYFIVYKDYCNKGELVPLLKVFDIDDKFVGLIMPMRKQ